MVISLMNQKGGVGKTTVALHLANAFEKSGKKVLVIDTDVLSCGIENYSLRKEKKRETKGKLNVIGLTNSDALHKQIEDFQDDFEILIIDCAAKVDKINVVSSIYSDIVIIPFQPSNMDIMAIDKTMFFIEKARSVKPDIMVYFLITMITPFCKYEIKEAKNAVEDFNTPLFKSVISRRKPYKQCFERGKFILDYTVKSAIPCHKEIRSLMKEIGNIYKQTEGRG